MAEIDFARHGGSAGMYNEFSKRSKTNRFFAILARYLAGEEANEVTVVASEPILDRNAYEGLRDLLGEDRTRHLHARLLVRVETCLAHSYHTDEDPQHLALEVHGLASASGMFGFLELSKACRVLERACLGTGDLARALKQFQAAAGRALRHKGGL